MTFHFSSFSIEHSESVMKVGVDAILLGAWAQIQDRRRILEVGTGSGVITVILAHRNAGAEIIAIDKSSAAVELANRNIVNAGLQERVDVKRINFHDVQISEQNPRFDSIISNPPFFKTDLRSGDPTRNEWRHSIDLDFDILLENTDLLDTEGSFQLILPYQPPEYFSGKAASCLMRLKRYCTIRPKEGKSPHRVLVEIEKTNGKNLAHTSLSEEIIIRNADGTYHHKFVELAGHLYDRPLNKKSPDDSELSIS